MKKHLAFVVVYYGAWPSWSSLFFKSCAANPGVDFLFVGDPPLRSLPSNCHSLKLSLSQFEGLVRDKMGLELRFLNPHKICDTRPAFGRLFERELADYQYWGYCDIDLVWGDLQYALSPEKVVGCDVFSASPHRIVGHCSVFRNDETINTYFFKAPTFQKIAVKSYSTHFDEGGIFNFLKTQTSAKIRFATPGPIENRWDSGLTFFYGNTALPEVGNAPSGSWNRGKVTVPSQTFGQIEMLYLHFMALKQKWHWLHFDPEKDYEEFYFNSAGFHPGIVTTPAADFMVKRLDWLKRKSGEKLRGLVDSAKFRKYLRG